MFFRFSGKRRQMLLALALQMVILAGANGTASAESFVEPGFEQQWKLTDEAVAKGQVSRTYFWGPQAFAHTNEVYNESPNNGQRRVQYFDKARMELSKRPGQDPNLVTNGLLTVELVSGRLQVGDNKFLLRQPANNPVAGDPTKNDAAPTYASFNRGKLAFGVEGATPALDRTNLAVVEAVNKAGEVSLLTQAPAPVRYARYFPQTGHNVADVFDNFFQAAPLGESRWLSVMGYPTSEPFWAKDKVTLAGKPTDVLIQLFERRILTYTPSNPAGFQVEMGNIGQHYYSWRYGVDARGELPGNFRVVYHVNNEIWSSAIRKLPDNARFGITPDPITGLWTLPESRVAVATGRGLYLADLSRVRALKALPYLPGFEFGRIENVIYSPNGQRLAAVFAKDNKIAVQVYNIEGLATDNLNVIGSFTAYESNNENSLITPTFSANGQYLGFTKYNEYSPRSSHRVIILDLNARSSKEIQQSATRLEWITQSDKFLLTSRSSSQTDNATGQRSIINGGVWLGEAPSGKLTVLLEGSEIRDARISPDGNYFLLREGTALTGPTNLLSNNFSFRALANPTVNLAPGYEQGTSGRTSNEPYIGQWSSDGTYALIGSSANFTGGANAMETTVLSTVTGRPIRQQKLEGNYNSFMNLTIGASHYTLTIKDMYNGPDRPIQQSIEVQNIDGSDNPTLYTNQLAGDGTNRFNIAWAKFTQVVPPAKN
jgi:hypothetical protein